jgi:hypothetical protein
MLLESPRRTRYAFSAQSFKERRVWLDHRVYQGRLCACALVLLSPCKNERWHADTGRRTRHALRPPLVLLLLLLWGNTDANARAVAVCCPICAKHHARAHAAGTKPRRYKRATGAIPPRAHLLCYRNARGGITEYVLEPKAKPVNALV